MALRSIAVGIMGLDMLKRICKDWDIYVSDHRVRRLFEQGVIESKTIIGKELLDYLNEKQIKELCRLYGIANTGRRQELIEKLLKFDRKKSPAFMAIDFETADYRSDSACAIALVKVKGLRIVQRHYYLIRPPRKRFYFTYLHGISWEHVRNELSFKELWPNVETLFKDIQFLVAHNAGFDQSVLTACCESNDINIPQVSFECTMRLSRQMWNIRPTNLKNVCNILQIPLVHHYALSDAEACARIFIRAKAEQGSI